ncbi:MAG TPA: divalent metal cation transporter [Candidatus Acidoferrales bacterium]|nr:divalent metal cation transporter [Candidatus Acidoferrales bacterium]
MNYGILLRYFRSPWFTRLILFLAIMGPGIITSSLDNDAPSIVTYSLAGSQFGYILLWTIIPMTVALAVVQEMGIRMGVVTGKGLASLIREKAGVRLTLTIMLVLVVVDFANTIAEFSGISVGGSIFGVQPFISLPLAGLFVWILVIKGNYRNVEKVFLGASALYVSYLISGFLAHPNWSVAGVNTVVPQISFDSAFILMLVGLVGNTIAPWMQFYIQASVVEKGVPLKHLNYSRTDAIVGSVITNVVAWFIIVACAATIFVHGIPVRGAADVAAALGPFAGNYASFLFAFGFLNAALFAASILPLSTAHYVCEALGFEAGVSNSFREAPIFHGMYAGIIILAVILMSLPGVPYLSILFLSQVANGILIPFVLIYMLVIANDRKIMGEYVNTRTFNIIAWATVIIAVTLSIILTLFSLAPR